MKCVRIAYNFTKTQYFLDYFIEHCILAVAFFLPLSLPVADGFLIAGILSWAAKLCITRQLKLKRTPFDEIIVMFVIFSAASIWGSPDRGFSFYNYYHLMGRYIFVYYLVVNNISTADQVRRLIGAVLASGLAVTLYGFYQYLFSSSVTSAEWVDNEQFPGLKFRVFSTLENPNLLGGFLVTIMSIAAGVGCKNSSLRLRVILGLFVALLGLCLLLTYSRGAWISVLAVIAFFGLVFNRKIFWLMLVLPIAAFFAQDVLIERLMSILNPTDTSSTLRLALWESTIAMIVDKPFFGIGWGAYWMVYPEYDFFINDSSTKIVHAHNMYLNFAAEIGIPGLIAFLGIIFGHIRAAVQVLGSAADELAGGLMLGIAAGMVGLVVNGFTDYIMFNIQMSMLFWLLNAVVVVIWNKNYRFSTNAMFFRKL